MSTIKVNKIENTTTSAGGVAIDSSGHVQVDGLQMPTAGALSNRNLIINGAMNVAQRGTSQTGVANSSNEGYQTLDRFGFIFASSATGACTISQSTDVPSSQGFSNSYKAEITTTATPTTNHYTGVYYAIEAQDLRNSGWNYTDSSSYVTLSFWVKSSKAGTYSWHLKAEDVGELYYTFEYTLAANTWTKITHSIPGNSSLVINNDNGLGVTLRWMLSAGSGRNSATADQWATGGTNTATSNQVNFFDTNGNVFYLTGVQLEVGEKATPFEHRSYGDELARCQRYYWQTATNNAFYSYQYISTHKFMPIFHPVKMRATPTATVPTNNALAAYQTDEIQWKGYVASSYTATSSTLTNGTVKFDAEL